MKQKKMHCPMMTGEMPMMCGMPMPCMMKHMPVYELQMAEMPMMEENDDMMLHHEDEEDDKYFMKMYPDACNKMAPYVKAAADKMEEKSMVYDGYPDREAIRLVVDITFKAMAAEMPDMEEEEETRQYGRRRFARDLFGVLVLNELLRRRRRFRRRPYYGGPAYGGPFYGGPYYDYEDYFDYYSD